MGGGKNQVLVSVLIPTYNCAQYIREAIDSVLAQDYDNLEIIVVDDGSTDNTKKIVATRLIASLHKTVKYFYKEHSGLDSTRNYCLKQASGDYIAWIDTDDIWEKGKLCVSLNYLEEHPDCRIVFTKYDNFFDNEAIEKELLDNPRVQHEIHFAEINKNYLLSSLAKKDIFEEYGNFCEEITTGVGDTELIHRLLLFGVDIRHCLNIVYYHRRLHGTNMTWTHELSSLPMIQKHALRDIRNMFKNTFSKNKIDVNES
jgi:glycosyltransferase involved in cell wall biosynthesis